MEDSASLELAMPSQEPPEIEHAALSDVGMRRAVNQDSVAVSCCASGPFEKGRHFFMVADGMGAHAAGELASKIAVDTVPHSFFKNRETNAAAALRGAVREANKRIFKKGSSEPEFHGMGTTSSCLVLSRTGALVAHVGDSRVYRLREGVLEQLTFDHSLVWEMADAINSTEADVPSTIPKNVITRSLGPHERVKIDLEGPHEVREGDTYLLCSDGLCGVVDDPTLGAVLNALGVDDAAQTLVDLANLHGGPDNISVIVVRVTRVSAAAPDEDASPTDDATGPVLLGAVAALAFLGAFVWFLSLDNALGMLFSAAACGASVVFASLKRDSSDDASLEPAHGAYGNGPYRHCDCNTPQHAADALHALVDEVSEANGDSAIRRAATEHVIERPAPTLKVDWGTYEERKLAADQSWKEGRHAEAVRAYCDLLRSVMREARSADP